jgi:ATP synthase protein I
MADDDRKSEADRRREFERKISEKEERRLRGEREKRKHVWFGLGMFGMVGWSVAIPTVIGAAAGVWIDKTFETGGRSWTLMLLFIGIIIGCVNAWFWVQRESKKDDND